MVKIKRLKLKNFLILKEVMGKDELELNFSDNPVCILIGQNGSGKSFLLTTISPAPVDNVKDRNKNPAIPNKIGEKEIDLELDFKYLYKIRIIYDTKTKTSCFISKYNLYTKEDLGELNKSGNVNTYYEVLEKELGWSKSYINVGYLSDSISSLVDMKPTERSQYLTAWLPQIQEYVDAYKIVSKKSNILNRQITMLNNDIGKLSDVDYDILIQNYNKSFEEKNLRYLDLLGKQTQCKTYLGLIPRYLREDLVSRVERLKSRSIVMNKKRDELLEDYKSLSLYSGKKGKEILEKTLKESENNITILTEKIKNSDENLRNYENEMNELKSENEMKTNIDNFIEIENTLNSLEDDIKDLEETRSMVLKRNPEYKELEILSKSDIDLFLSFLESLIDTRRKVFELVEESYLKDNEIFTSSNEKMIDLIQVYQRRIDDLEERILYQTNRIYALKNSSSLTNELLALKPKDCKKECPIVKTLYSYLNPENEIKVCDNILKGFISEKEEFNRKLESVKNESQRFSIALSLIKEMNDKIMRNKELILKFPDYIKESFSNPDVCAILNSIPSILDKVNGFKEYIYLLEKLSISKESQYSTSVTYNLMKHQKNLDEKWQKLHEKWLETSKSRDFLIQDLQTNQNTEKRLKDINLLNEQNKEKIDSYNSEANSLLNEKKMLETIAKNIYYRNRLLDTNDLLEIEITKLKNELDDITSKLENIKSKKNSMTTLIETRDNLLKKKNRYDILTNIWSPKIGYPSWEMEDFLDTLTIQTNSDLEIMWGGNLSIKRFEIGADTFKIVVNRNGVEIDDATECSKGERGTLAMAISFAIIEINLRFRKYNVLRFDEVDGPFDDNRRRGFIETVIKRLPALDCGNLFIITHNNEFSDIDADMVILNGANEDVNMENKNVIYHY